MTRTASTIPEGWQSLRLDQVGTVATGSTPPTANRSLYGREKMFVSPADLGSSKYVSKTLKRLSAAGFARSRRFPAGSTLFVCIGSTIGKVGLAAEELTSNQQINAVIPGAGIDPEYLYYAANTLSSLVRSRAGEQAVPIVNKADFSEFEILVPPLPEQRKIALTLADVDALIDTLERLIAKKHATKQGMMQELLRGKQRLPGFTGAWPDYQFWQVLQSVNTRHSRVDASEYRSSGLLPVVDQGKTQICGYVNAVRKPLKPGVKGFIVFGDHTCIVKFVDFDFAVGADGTKVLEARAGFSARFIVYLLQLCPIESTGYNRHFSFLKQRHFCVPPLVEQAAIADVVRDVDSELRLLEAKMEKLRAVKQGMMQGLLTGQTRLALVETHA